MGNQHSLQPIVRAMRSVWAAALLGVAIWSVPAQASELALRGDQILFSDLDGSAADVDGVADGTLTLDLLKLTGNAEILVDAPAARFAVSGDVALAGTSSIRNADGRAPEIVIQAGGSIRLAGNSSVRSDSSAGGDVRLCAGGDLEVGGNATVSASAVEATGAGGSVHLEANGRLSIDDAAASVHANGANGGSVTLVSCGAGATGPGRSAQNAALAILGRVEAVGTAGTGGTVEIEARQGGVAFGSVLAAVDARGTALDGSVSVTAGADVSPPVPPTEPAATVAASSPSSQPCGCSDGGPGVGGLVVAADVDRPTGLAGTQFSFSGRVVQSSSPVVDWQWTLSDGRQMSGQTISVSFPAPGLYGATLTVTDQEGATLTSKTGVVVFDPDTQAPPEMQLPDLIGDVDGNGAITLADALRVAKHAGGLEALATDAVPAADMDLDQKVTPADAVLLGQAVAAGASLPSALLPDHGAPGAAVTVVSPELLDPTALIEVQVGESLWTQTPLRVARGYATFAVPFDATVRDSMRVEPGPVDVRILSDGVVVDVLTLEVEAPLPEPLNPRAELASFLDTYIELFELNRQALAALFDYSAVDGDDEELALAAFTGAYDDASAKAADLKALLDQPGGEELARLFFLYANANGYADYRQQLEQFVTTQHARISELRLAVKAGSADIDQILAIICAVKDASDLLQTGGNILSYGCDALLVAAVIAAVIPADGPAGEAALLFTWASACGTVETTVELALLINELVGGIEPDLRFAANPTSPGAGESVELKAEIELTGLDDVCSFAIGKGRDELIEELAETAVERLLRKKLALKALAGAIELLSEDLLEELEDRLEELVVRVVNDTALGDMMNELTSKVCDIFQLGVPLVDDLSRIMEGPVPNVGNVGFNGDGTATYMCPDSGTTSEDSVTFTARRDICGEMVEKTATVQCETRPVTITMGDNGSANDDIYEVRIAGETVLTSSVPVRAISTTVELPVGDHVVEMLGRAAPDGIGTYYIRFSGATVIGGDATSGFDLTPGVTKTFIIRVQ